MNQKNYKRIKCYKNTANAEYIMNTVNSRQKSMELDKGQ